MLDTQLVQKYRATGEEVYYNELCRRHTKRLETILARYLVRRPALDQQAIINDTLLTFHRYCLSDAPLRNVSAWLCQTLKFAAQAALRWDHRQKRDSRLNVWLEGDNALAPGAEPLDAMVTHEEFKRLHAVVAKLSEPARTIVSQRLSGRSNTWIAKHLSMPVGTVKTHYRSAVAQLKRQL